MNIKRNKHFTPQSILAAGVAVIAVGFAAPARPAAAQMPLLSHHAQVLQLFGDRDHDNGGDRNRGRDRNRDQNRDRQRAEQARRYAERARHEAEARRDQWQRNHRHDRDHHGDHDRNDSHGDQRGDR